MHSSRATLGCSSPSTSRAVRRPAPDWTARPHLSISARPLRDPLAAQSHDKLHVCSRRLARAAACAAEQFAPRDVNFTHPDGTPRPHDRSFHIWEDIAELRGVYRARGCGFVLATLLRRPVPDLYVSDYLFEGVHMAPRIGEWVGRDIQTAALLGWPHGWNSRTPLTAAHVAQARAMLDSFDVVGTTERFAEAVLLIARAAGLQHAMYRRMNQGNLRPQRDQLLADPRVTPALARLATVDQQL
eukprot:3322697-Prymnesium_polylepis.1